MKIVVTGLGLVCAVGGTVDDSWKALRNGDSGISRTTIVDTEAMISDLAGQAWSVEDDTPGIDRCHRIALQAAREAVSGSGLSTAGYRPDRIGLSVGTSLGGTRSAEAFHRRWISDGLRRADNRLLRYYPLHSVADMIAADLAILGPRTVLSNACAAGAVAIGYALDLLWSGDADAVLCGGVDPLSVISFGGFSCLGALDPRQCAPYSRSTGLNLGEGGGFLVLERADRAAERGAPGIVEIAGYGLSADAFHPTAPDPGGQGALRAMREALAVSGTDPGDVDYVNGHGTGTPANDSVEPKAIMALGVTPPFSSTKSMIGHTLGAAGAIEAVTTALAIQDGVLPPTLVPDDLAGVPRWDIVPDLARPAVLRAALSNSFAFGGNNAAVVLRRHGADMPVPPAALAAQAPRDVVITGVGAVAGAAIGNNQVWARLRDGLPVYDDQRCDIDGFGSLPVGETPAELLRSGINPSHLRKMDPLSRRAAVAVGQMLADRVGLTREQAAGTGLLFATGSGPISTVEQFHRELVTHGTGNTRLFPNTVMNAAAGHIAVLHGLRGHTATICAGGTSGITALHYATRLIQRRAADRIIVVTADEAPPALLAGYARIPGYLSRHCVIPYGGSGLVLGGGAVAMLVEAADNPDRGEILATIAGFGLVGDASGLAALDDGAGAWAQSFDLALDRAGCTPDDVDLVIAAASGHARHDQPELRALRSSGLDVRPITAPKSVLGEAYATSGLTAVAEVIWAAQHDRLPSGGPASGARATPPADLPPGFIGPEGRAAVVRTGLVSSYAIGGSYQSVVLRTSSAQ